MTTILDLPVHPLAVHAPVIFVPLLVLFGLLYLFVPPVRRRIGWIVGLLTIVAPASVYGAIWSGEQLADHSFPDGWPAEVDDHRAFGVRLLWILIGLIPVWWLFAALERGRRSAAIRNESSTPAPDANDGDTVPVSADDPAAKGRRVVMVVLGAIALALLGLAGWMVFEAGESGASMVWSDLVG